MGDSKQIMVIGCGDSGTLKLAVLGLDAINEKIVLFHTVPTSINKEGLQEVVLQYHGRDMEVILVSDSLTNINAPSMPEQSMPELIKNIIRDSQKRLEFIDYPIIEENSKVNPQSRHNFGKGRNTKYNSKKNYKRR